jgi:hypothetical protein
MISAFGTDQALTSAESGRRGALTRLRHVESLTLSHERFCRRGEAIVRRAWLLFHRGAKS